MRKFDEPDWATLHRLADALGVPVERFFAEKPPAGEAASTDECLRLWFKIETEEGRRQALEALRGVAEREEP